MIDNFQVGQRIVCVDDSDVDDTGASIGIRYLRRGRTYTVLSTYVLLSGPGVTLKEVEIPYSYKGFRAARFRAALEHEVDISVFIRALESKSLEPT